MTATQSQIRDALDEMPPFDHHERDFWRWCGRHYETLRTILQSALDTQKPAGEPMITTHHFHNKPMPLAAVLFALAGQEGNDGDEGNVMQAAGEYIRALNGDCGGGDLEALALELAATSCEYHEGAGKGIKQRYMRDADPNNGFIRLIKGVLDRHLTADNAKRGE